MNPLEVSEFVDRILKEFDERGLDDQERVAIAGRLMMLVYQKCNITRENFLYICRGIATASDMKKFEEEDNKNV